MPTSYYGLVHPIGPYKQTSRDKKYLGMKDTPMLGGGVAAGTTHFAGHGNWLQVMNPVQARIEPVAGLGLEKPSPYGTPSVVIQRKVDQEAMLSPHQRQAYYNQGMFGSGAPSQRASQPMMGGGSQPQFPIIGGNMPTQMPPVVDQQPDTSMYQPALILPTENGSIVPSSTTDLEAQFEDNVAQLEEMQTDINNVIGNLQNELSKNPLKQTETTSDAISEYFSVDEKIMDHILSEQSAASKSETQALVAGAEAEADLLYLGTSNVPYGFRRPVSRIPEGPGVPVGPVEPMTSADSRPRTNIRYF